MSDYQFKPSLPTLPPELLELIIKALEDDLLAPCPTLHRFKYEQVFRPLSQTCRRLRAFALPMVWSSVHVSTVAQLGTLRDLIRAEPSIAGGIRSFEFSWNLGFDCWKCDAYGDEVGSLLEMAFIDRGAVWDEYRRGLGAEAQSVFDDETPDDYPLSSFVHEGVVYIEPGSYAPGASARAKLVTSSDDQDCISRPFHTYSGPNVYRAGPDGDGEDERIRSAKEFNDCFAEIAAQLTSLVALKWASPATPMPDQVFDALKGTKRLETLHLNLECRKKNLHALPFWELASNLKHLTISSILTRNNDAQDLLPINTYWADIHQKRFDGECYEQHLTEFELPLTRPAESVAAARDAHYSIAARTIVAAARGGKLRTLKFIDSWVHEPFAVRALVPFWIDIEEWQFDMYDDEEWDNREHWIHAAASLRHVLAYASRNLNGREDRLLTRENVQALLAQSYAFSRQAMELLYSSWYPENPIKQYLRWFAEDEELAQQVADAWNAVVQRGEADLPVKVNQYSRCDCRKVQAMESEEDNSEDDVRQGETDE